MTTEEAISHFRYGLTRDIYSEPVASYARAAIAALRAQQEAEKNEPLTNGDRIRAMNDEELVEFLDAGKFYDICEEGCGACHYNGDCKRRLADWLQQPAEGETT